MNHRRTQPGAGWARAAIERAWSGPHGAGHHWQPLESGLDG
ncbi:hypothetical protein [Streptomyces antnestii]|nr:hypothetical protein [Streptomyces sp. San01]